MELVFCGEITNFRTGQRIPMINLEYLVVPESKEMLKQKNPTPWWGMSKELRRQLRVPSAKFGRNNLSNKIIKVVGNLQPVFF